jgi:uncharacterized membrane protein YjgN (DUF898 family)
LMVLTGGTYWPWAHMAVTAMKLQSIQVLGPEDLSTLVAAIESHQPDNNAIISADMAAADMGW